MCFLRSTDIPETTSNPERSDISSHIIDISHVESLAIESLLTAKVCGNLNTQDIVSTLKDSVPVI